MGNLKTDLQREIDRFNHSLQRLIAVGKAMGEASAELERARTKLLAIYKATDKRDHKARARLRLVIGGRRG